MLRPLGTLIAALALAAPAWAQDKPTPDASKETVLRLGSLAPEGTPWADLLEKFKEKVESVTGGAVKVRLYLNARQGDEDEMLAKMKDKKLEGGGFTSTGLASVVPATSLLEVPFLFADDAEVDHIIDQVVRADLQKHYEEKGLYLYAWAVNGWVDIGSTQKAIVSMDGVKAAKPYARESGARSAFWTACGGKPEILKVPDVMAALKGGKIDCYDTTPLFATAAQWYTVTKHWTDSNHIYQPAAVVIDLAWWKALPEATRKALEGHAAELESSSRKAVRGLDASLMDEMRRHGIEVHALPEAERTTMKKATAKVAEELAEKGTYPRALLEKVHKALEARRSAAAAPSAPKTDPVADRLAAADRHAAKRPVYQEMLRGEYELQEALRVAPQSYDAHWRMARMQLYIGRFGAEAQRLDKFQKAIDWSKKTIALDPKRVEGHFWLAVSYGLFGETKGITSSLFLVDDMQESLEKANSIDPKFDGAGAPRILGRLYFKLPWAAGGSNKKAIEYLRKAMELDPGMPNNYTYLAEVLIDEDDEAGAKKLLDQLDTLKVEPWWEPELKEAKDEAKKLRKQL